MIKIEFKEALKANDGFRRKFLFVKEIVSAGINFSSVMFMSGNTMFLYTSNILKCNCYIPTQDPYIDRSFILQQLGISKEQDEEMQQKYK